MRNIDSVQYRFFFQVCVSNVLSNARHYLTIRLQARDFYAVIVSIVSAPKLLDMKTGEARQ